MAELSIRYVDVSDHDWTRRGGPIDWAQVATAASPDVMCARASYGDPQGFSPPTFHFAAYVTSAKAAGFTVRGGYHNLIRSPDQAGINRQVDYLRRQLDLHDVEWAMLDVEAYPELVQAGLVPRWTDVQRWRDRWVAVEQRVCAWYIARWVWRDHLGRPDLTVLPGPLINASYAGGTGSPGAIYAAAGADIAAGWRPYGERVPDILQYTEAATVPGITRPGTPAAAAKCDCNAHRGTRDQLIALLTSPEGDDDVDQSVLDQLNRIELHVNRVELTLGSFTLGAEETVPMPNSEGGTDSYPVVPNAKFRELSTALTGLAATIGGVVTSVANLVEAVARIGTDSPEVAELVARIRVELATQTAALQAAMRDTIATFGEGGAEKVRAAAQPPTG